MFNGAIITFLQTFVELLLRTKEGEHGVFDDQDVCVEKEVPELKSRYYSKS